jgi:hypothetical protein
LKTNSTALPGTGEEAEAPAPSVAGVEGGHRVATATLSHQAGEVTRSISGAPGFFHLHGGPEKTLWKGNFGLASNPTLIFVARMKWCKEERVPVYSVIGYDP